MDNSRADVLHIIDRSSPLVSVAHSPGPTGRDNQPKLDDWRFSLYWKTARELCQSCKGPDCLTFTFGTGNSRHSRDNAEQDKEGDERRKVELHIGSARGS